MALTTAEIQECKFRLGYGNLTFLARPYFDIALVFEDVVQQNVDTTFGEPYLRSTIFPNLQQLDIDIMNCRTRFQASALVGEVILNPKELDRLLDLRYFWTDQLSNLIKVPIAEPINRAHAAIELT